MNAPARLSTLIAPTLREVNLAYVRQQTIRHLDASLKELTARRAFHLDPTHHNLTAWADAKEELEQTL